MEGTEPQTPEQWRQVLRAHEALAELDSTNRRQFERIVEQLREELGELEHSR